MKTIFSLTRAPVLTDIFSRPGFPSDHSSGSSFQTNEKAAQSHLFAWNVKGSTDTGGAKKWTAGQAGKDLEGCIRRLKENTSTQEIATLLENLRENVATRVETSRMQKIYATGVINFLSQTAFKILDGSLDLERAKKILEAVPSYIEAGASLEKLSKIRDRKTFNPTESLEPDPPRASIK